MAGRQDTTRSTIQLFAQAQAQQGQLLGADAAGLVLVGAPQLSSCQPGTPGGTLNANGSALMLTTQSLADQLASMDYVEPRAPSLSADFVDTQLSTQQLEAVLLETNASDWLSSVDQQGTGRMGGSDSVALLDSTGGNGAGTGGAMDPNSASVYVKNLSSETDELWLYQKFAPFGALRSCKVKTDPTTGKCRGVGFVNYVDQASAMRALQQLDGTRTPEGRQLHITLQAPRAVRAARAAAAAVSSMPNLTPMLPTSNTPVAHPGLQLPQYTVSPNTHLTQLLATLQLSSANNQALRGQRYPQYGPFTQ